ncbi:hypothetical protein GCM10009597_26680 [Peribacillus frigoritolerans]
MIKKRPKEIKESITDSESGYYVKDERTKQFAYSFHAAADHNGFVLGTIGTPGNTHDSQILESLVEQVIEKVGRKPLPQIHLIKHQRLQATYLTKKSYRLYLINLYTSSVQAMLTFAAINLKKMANWTWRGPKMA